MSTNSTGGTALSDIIVSVAEGVNEANRVLNEDPQSTLAISRFNIDTSLYASLSVPRERASAEVATYGLRATEAGTYRIDRPEGAIRPARLQNWIRPKLTDTALLRGNETRSARVQIEATLEAVPNVEDV